MRYIFDLCWHYLSSNSRHGTHSPFVYRLADQVVYRNANTLSKSQASKYELLINELKGYLETVDAVEFDYSSQHKVVDVDLLSLDTEAVVDLSKRFSVVFVRNIYANKHAKQRWLSVIQDPKVIVSIDLFYFGLLINRKAQPKENFKLRFPYTKYLF